MAHILQNILPDYVPVFRTEIIEQDFDDADFELLAVQDYWACHTATVEAA